MIQSAFLLNRQWLDLDWARSGHWHTCRPSVARACDSAFVPPKPNYRQSRSGSRIGTVFSAGCRGLSVVYIALHRCRQYCRHRCGTWC